MADLTRLEALSLIHEQVAGFVKQLDELMRDISPEQAAELVDEARHLLTVATFLRDATIDLLEAGGSPVDDTSAGVVGPEPIDAE